MKKTIIISLGGSIIVPDEIDVFFLKKFRKLIVDNLKRYKFVIYCGGGIIARKYQKAANQIINADNISLDWLGISATSLNAFLMKVLFSKYAEDEVITDPTKKISFKKRIIIASGWKPGWSTDYDAVLAAKSLNANILINVTNVDYVYDKNPKKHKDAKPIKAISWKEFRKIVGSKWNPGLNMPFDPIAAKEAEKIGLKVIVTGKSLINLKNILNNNNKFKGTIIY